LRLGEKRKEIIVLKSLDDIDRVCSNIVWRGGGVIIFNPANKEDIEAFSKPHEMIKGR
jgi:hypothetical protein